MSCSSKYPKMSSVLSEMNWIKEIPSSIEPSRSKNSLYLASIVTILSEKILSRSFRLSSSLSNDAL